MRLPDRELCESRLELIFPPELPQHARLTGRLASAAVFVCLYAGAVGGRRMIRPSMALWMSDAAARRCGDAEREAWYAASRSGKRRLAELLAEWGEEHRPWYADNTREPLRDETFRAWARYGAIQRDETVPTTSSRPQWSLTEDFAALFDPDLSDQDAEQLALAWRRDHLGPVGLARVAVAAQLAGAESEVVVDLPRGGRRTLAAGGSSLILKGVIEQLAPRLLEQPALLFVSESRLHVDVIDAQTLARLELEIAAERLLPDAMLFDAGPGLFWFVEVVLTDGAITEERRLDLLDWAEAHDIPRESCRFLTAFAGRTAAPFRRLVASLAWNSVVWFLDEPDRILRLDELPERTERLR